MIFIVVQLKFIIYFLGDLEIGGRDERWKRIEVDWGDLEEKRVPFPPTPNPILLLLLLAPPITSRCWTAPPKSGAMLLPKGTSFHLFRPPILLCKVRVFTA